MAEKTQSVIEKVRITWRGFKRWTDKKTGEAKSALIAQGIVELPATDGEEGQKVLLYEFGGNVKSLAIGIVQDVIAELRTWDNRIYFDVLASRPSVSKK